MALNRFSETEMHDLTFRACVAAVAEGFPHLAVEHIVEPPHPWFDAALARQVVLHLMVARFSIPRRRINLDRGWTREMIQRGIGVIDNRLDHPTFEAHYRRIAARAEALLADLIRKAAAA